MAKKTDDSKTPAPVIVATDDSKRTRGNLSPEARAKATRSRHERSVINDYIAALQPQSDDKRASARAERLAEVETMLSAGVKKKPIPVFNIAGSIRSRAGTNYEDRPLSAVERAELITAAATLRKPHASKKVRELRTEAVAVLATFAARNGYSRDTLIAIGFPPVDLDDAGIAAV